MSLLPRNDPSAQQSNPLHTQMKCTNEAGRAGGRGLGFLLSRSPAFPRPCHVRHADKVGALTWDHDVLVVRAVRSLLGMSLGSSRWALHKSLRPTGEGFATLALTSVKRLTGQMPQAIAWPTGASRARPAADYTRPSFLSSRCSGLSAPRAHRRAFARAVPSLSLSVSYSSFTSSLGHLFLRHAFLDLLE